MIGPGLTCTMRPSTSKSCSLRRRISALSCSSSRVRLSSSAGGGLSRPTGGSWKAWAPPVPKSKVSCHASPCSMRRPRGRVGSTTTGRGGSPASSAAAAPAIAGGMASSTSRGVAGGTGRPLRSFAIRAAASRATAA